MGKWIAIDDHLPKEGILVYTKIQDENGVRNEQVLYRVGKKWFLPDTNIYVYYTPTHWRLM